MPNAVEEMLRIPGKGGGGTELNRFLFPTARTPVSFHIRGAAVK